MNGELDEDLAAVASVVVGVVGAASAMLLSSNAPKESSTSKGVKKPRKRRSTKIRERIHFDLIKEQLLNYYDFEVDIRLKPAKFESLCRLLAKSLTPKRSANRNYLSVETKVLIGMKMMSGSSYNDTAFIAKVGYGTVYKAFAEFRVAVRNDLEPLMFEDLKTRMPSSRAASLARGFAQRSGAPTVFSSCVGAVDGWVREIQAPTVLGTSNVSHAKGVQAQTAFYNGHYCCYAVVCQAMCDSKGKFLYFSAKHSGSTHDSTAFQTCDLKTFVENLAGTKYYIVGDNGYVGNNNCLTPFRKGQIVGEDLLYKDSYNFHQSQQRIIIECAFGRLTKKFRIFKSASEFDLEKALEIILTGACLHNFAIDEEDEDFDILEEEGVRNGEETHTFREMFEMGNSCNPRPTVHVEKEENLCGHASQTRMMQMVDQLKEKGLLRGTRRNTSA
eukprot:Nk52_evm15s1892 gene=Nk52_evmTU15s1892